jgi:hypothetical protein
MNKLISFQDSGRDSIYTSRVNHNQVQWLMPIIPATPKIPATREAEIRKIKVSRPAGVKKLARPHFNQEAGHTSVIPATQDT